LELTVGILKNREEHSLHITPAVEELMEENLAEALLRLQSHVLSDMERNPILRAIALDWAATEVEQEGSISFTFLRGTSPWEGVLGLETFSKIQRRILWGGFVYEAPRWGRQCECALCLAYKVRQMIHVSGRFSRLPEPEAFWLLSHLLEELRGELPQEFYSLVSNTPDEGVMEAVRLAGEELAPLPPAVERVPLLRLLEDGLLRGLPLGRTLLSTVRRFREDALQRRREDLIAGREEERRKSLLKLSGIYPTFPYVLPEGITQILSPQELVSEGSSMGHCVGSYAEAPWKGPNFFFHVSHMGERATIQVEGGRVYQAYGPKNSLNEAVSWGRMTLEKILGATRKEVV